MIKYGLEDKNSPVIHEVKFPISRKELQRVRLLLDLKYENWEEKELKRLNIIKDSSECIFGVSFNDGASLDWKLCCGDCNYYDNILFQYPNGTTVTLDCAYDIDDIEIDASTDIYIVRLAVQDE